MEIYFNACAMGGGRMWMQEGPQSSTAPHIVTIVTRGSSTIRLRLESPDHIRSERTANHNSSVHNMSTILHPNVRVRGGIEFESSLYDMLKLLLSTLMLKCLLLAKILVL
jgi:hypothetical protein